MKTLMVYRASVQTILFSRWSRVSPLGQAPISISLNTMCLLPPLIDAASIRGKVASQSVQKRILEEKKPKKGTISIGLYFQRKVSNKWFFNRISKKGCWNLQQHERNFSAFCTSYTCPFVLLLVLVCYTAKHRNCIHDVVTPCINTDTGCDNCLRTAPAIQCNPQHLQQALKWDTICFIMTFHSSMRPENEHSHWRDHLQNPESYSHPGHITYVPPWSTKSARMREKVGARA